MTTNQTTTELSQKLAKRFQERAAALGFKGKKRDDAALDYWCGAASVLEEIGHPSAAAFAAQVVLMISVRGYFAICELAKEG